MFLLKRLILSDVFHRGEMDFICQTEIKSFKHRKFFQMQTPNKHRLLERLRLENQMEMQAEKNDKSEPLSFHITRIGLNKMEIYSVRNNC